ncbi:sigma-54 interaction domain-containing protein [Maridesulfovibrio sp.]|uniref:sigma-54 interaction domain-containing protein n=1 Tax=unclassified Maridesulfovibrio TaxID=2794999 RepID=UPI003B00F25E
MPQQSDFFQEATEALFKDLEGDVVLSNILRFLHDYMPVSAIGLLRYVHDKNAVEFISTAFAGKNRNIPQYYKFSATEKEEAVSVTAAIDDLHIVNDADFTPAVIRDVAKIIIPGKLSFIRISLIWDSVRLGSLFIYAEETNQYKEKHLDQLKLLRKPFTMAVANILRHRTINELRAKLEEENRALKNEISHSTDVQIIGAEFGLKKVMEQIRQVAPTDSTVLLMGETGVGKDIIANSLHQYSARRNRPFIKVNCGAIPESLIDSELFGHEKGAFTGALKRKKGRFERANFGTIFLDEVGELPLSAQVRLLRILQNKEFERVGGADTISVDTRIIAATNRDLSAMVKEGEFREDLFFRLNVFPIQVPPLRERVSDIPELVTHFLEKKSASLNLRKTFNPAPDTIQNMMEYAWPGNVRELENVIERELIRSNSKAGEKHIYFGAHTPSNSKADIIEDDTILTLDQAMARHIRSVLERAEGKVEGKNGAAELLGMNPGTLRSRMRKLGIKFGRKVS